MTSIVDSLQNKFAFLGLDAAILLSSIITAIIAYNWMKNINKKLIITEKY